VAIRLVMSAAFGGIVRAWSKTPSIVILVFVFAMHAHHVAAAAFCR
jgi:hypothetical protein